MPTVTLSDGCKIFYREDDFTDPWKKNKPTVMMLHGFCRNSNFWYPWVPYLSRHFRVLRWDARGCGDSSKYGTDFGWSIEQYHKDLMEFLDAVGVESAYFVGESLGGMVMPYFADWSPSRIKGIVVCASHPAIRGQVARDLSTGADSMAEAISKAGTLVDYIRPTGLGRLSQEDQPDEAREWYAQEWARTPRETWIAWSSKIVPAVDLTPERLAKVRQPVLYIGPSRSPRLTMAECRVWVDNVPDIRFAVVDSSSQGLAIARADECARHAADFLNGLAGVK